MRLLTRWAAVVAAVALSAAVPAIAHAAAPQPPLHQVLVVGNNWDGTADVIDPRTFKKLIRLNIVPDKDQRIAEINADPAAKGFFTGINLLIGEGHNQYVDDAFTSHDGRFLFVSRPSFKDVVGIDLRTRRIAWRVQVDGYRSDHMAISPSGRRLLVSASTANVVDEIDTEKGKIVRKFPSGDSPHESNYIHGGRQIVHASIGRVYTPTDDPETGKGERYFQVVDNRTFKILSRVDMGKKLEEAGHPGMSSAVRPMAVAPGDRYVYLQVSFFHGFVEYDLQKQKVLRLAHLPLSEKAKKMRRDEYILDSAHHGIAINPAGRRICVAGTMSDYAAMVERSTFTYKIVAHGERPYWVTNSGDGRYCFISFSGNDAVAALSYAKRREVARVPVGDHPQRMRIGQIRCGYLGPKVDCTRPRMSRLRVMKTSDGRRLRARLSEHASLRIAISRLTGGRWAHLRTVEREAKKGMNLLALGGLASASRYRLSITATDAAGNESRTRPAQFRIRFR